MFRQQLFPLELKLTFAGIQCRINLLAWSFLDTGSLTGNLTCQTVSLRCTLYLQLAISEFSFASVSKWVSVWNHSYENTFHQQVYFHVTQTHFRMKDLAWELVLKQAQCKLWNALLCGNDGMIVGSVTKLSPPLLCCPTVLSRDCGSVKNTCKVATGQKTVTDKGSS